VFEEAF